MAGSPPDSPYDMCPLGEGQNCRFTLPAVVRMSDADGTSVYCCDTCGHGVTRPPIDDVAALYDGRESQDYQRRDQSIAERIKKWAFSRQARLLVKALPEAPHSAVDYGCGSGLFSMCVAAQLEKGAVMTALDFFPDPPRDMGRVRYRSFDNWTAADGRADTVFCFHALEHDNDPDDFMRRLSSLLQPHGILVIEVPNVKCLWARIFGRHWDNWYLPYHRVHYSPASLRALISRHGFEIIDESAICIPSMGRSLARMSGNSNTLFFLLIGMALHPLQWLGEVLTGRASAIRITARLSQSAG